MREHMAAELKMRSPRTQLQEGEGREQEELEENKGGEVQEQRSIWQMYHHPVDHKRAGKGKGEDEMQSDEDKWRRTMWDSQAGKGQQRGSTASSAAAASSRTNSGDDRQSPCRKEEGTASSESSSQGDDNQSKKRAEVINESSGNRSWQHHRGQWTKAGLTQQSGDEDGTAAQKPEKEYREAGARGAGGEPKREKRRKKGEHGQTERKGGTNKAVTTIDR